MSCMVNKLEISSDEQKLDSKMPIEGCIFTLRLQTEGVLNNPDALAITKSQKQSLITISSNIKRYGKH